MMCTSAGGTSVSSPAGPASPCGERARRPVANPMASAASDASGTAPESRGNQHRGACTAASSPQSRIRATGCSAVTARSMPRSTVNVINPSSNRCTLDVRRPSKAAKGASGDGSAQRSGASATPAPAWPATMSPAQEPPFQPPDPTCSGNVRPWPAKRVPDCHADDLDRNGPPGRRGSPRTPSADPGRRTLPPRLVQAPSGLAGFLQHPRSQKPHQPAAAFPKVRPGSRHHEFRQRPRRIPGGHPRADSLHWPSTRTYQASAKSCNPGLCPITRTLRTVSATPCSAARIAAGRQIQAVHRFDQRLSSHRSSASSVSIVRRAVETRTTSGASPRSRIAWRMTTADRRPRAFNGRSRSDIEASPQEDFAWRRSRSWRMTRPSCHGTHALSPPFGSSHRHCEKRQRRDDPVPAPTPPPPAPPPTPSPPPPPPPAARSLPEAPATRQSGSRASSPVIARSASDAAISAKPHGGTQKSPPESTAPNGPNGAATPTTHLTSSRAQRNPNGHPRCHPARTRSTR